MHYAHSSSRDFQNGRLRSRALQSVSLILGLIGTDAFMILCCNSMQKERHMLEYTRMKNVRDLAYYGWVKTQYNKFPSKFEPYEPKLLGQSGAPDKFII